MKTNIHFWSYLAQFFLEWEMFQTKVVEKIKRHTLGPTIFFFWKSFSLWHDVEKYCREGQATDDNMAHAYCMQDNENYTHTHTLFNTHCFSTATMVARTQLIVTLYVNGLSCFLLQFAKSGTKNISPAPPPHSVSVHDQVRVSCFDSPYARWRHCAFVFTSRIYRTSFDPFSSHKTCLRKSQYSFAWRSHTSPACPPYDSSIEM
jgi:hypothetical protein